MALKQLTVDEMIALTDPWVHDPKTRSRLESIDEVRGLVKRIDEAHRAVVSVRPNPAVAAELSTIVAEEQLVDARHDCLARAVHHALSAHLELALGLNPPDRPRADDLRLALDELFPSGLEVLSAPLISEAGNSERVAQVLDRNAPLSALLAGIPVRPSMSVLDVARRWVVEGGALGRLEQKRVELAAMAALTRPEDAPSLHDARALWLRVVSLVLLALDVSRSPEAEPIRAQLLEASARAARQATSS